MGITWRYVHRHLFIPAVVPRPFCRSGNRETLFVVLAISLGLSWILALTQTTTFGNFILKAKSGDTNKDPYDKPFYHKFASILGVLIKRRLLHWVVW